MTPDCPSPIPDPAPLTHLRLAVEGPERRLAVRARAGRGPAIVWLGGFRSDMDSTKALALDAFAAGEGRACLRFDYAGHGQSEGDFAACTISTWLADALAVLRAHGGQRPLLVGSSMGGWIALRVCEILQQAPPEQRPGGLVLIAPAVDFTQELMWERFPAEIRAQIEDDGVWLRPSAYSPEPYPITRGLIEDGRRHLMFNRPISPGCPVQILQGMQDPDVPHSHALRLMEHLTGADASLTLIKDGDHRLSRDADIALLVRSVAAMLSG